MDFILRETVIDTQLEDVIDSGDFMFCQNCLRQSTTFYPLTLTKVQAMDVRKKKFGSNDIWKNEVVLCESHCVFYLGEATETSWNYAWPSFFASYLSDKRDGSQFLWSILPQSLREHYRITLFCEFFSVNCGEGGSFVDVTRDFIHFLASSQSESYDEIIVSVDSTSFPKVICPCGSWLFFDECEKLPFRHYLATLNYDKVSFSQSNKSFTGMRADFLDNIKFLNVSDVNASLVVDDTLGICLLVCELHKSGLPLKYVHAPRHPMNDFISSTHADRLAPVVPSLRTVRSAKAKHSSYEYRLLNLTGDHSGSHVMTLSTAKNMHLQEWENVHYIGEFFSNAP